MFQMCSFPFKFNIKLNGSNVAHLSDPFYISIPDAIYDFHLNIEI